MNNIKFLKYLSLVISTLILISACSSKQKLSNQNVAFIYNKSPFSFKENFKVFNVNDSVTSLFYKINTENLLFKKNDEQPKPTAEVEITYKIYNNKNQNHLIKHGTFSIDKIEKKTMPYDINGKIDLELQSGNSYLLEIITTDFNRTTSQRSFLSIEKNGLNSRENFILRDSKTKLPLLKNYLKQNEAFILEYNEASIKTIYVKYYSRNYPVAMVPFETEPQKPLDMDADSVFSFDLDQNSSFSFSKKGFYHFYADTNNQNGFTLFIYDENFPYSKSPKDLISPLIYITNKEEFEKLQRAANEKEAVDKFWLQLGGNTERAKELIRIYYNRIKEANEYFSSYLEGWKSDRGIIFTIFGSPDIVYKYQNSEIWIYGEENNLMSLNFTFLKLENPFTDNDFSLDRSPVYSNNWYQAVDIWRQGRVY